MNDMLKNNDTDIQKVIFLSRVQNLAEATIKRAILAGIPPEYQKITESEFRELLFDPFFNERKLSAEKIAKAIFQKTEMMFSKMFILIDGGDAIGLKRSKAGYAILFKLITKDFTGKHIQGKSLIHSFNDFAQDRISLINEYKNVDALFISEISLQDFRVGSDAGSYFDELLEYRFSHGLPTILSWSRPISALEKSEINDERAGRFLLQLYHADAKKNEELIFKDLKSIRIRVK